MWSIVAFSQSAPFSYWNPPFGTVDCFVSGKGVFTAFFRNKDHISPKPANVPVGVRYDPETDRWTSIRTSSIYGWNTDSVAHMSFYVNMNGVGTLIHMFTDAWIAVVRFGVVNESGKYLQLAGVWKLDETSGEYTISNNLGLLPKPWVSGADPPRPGFFQKSRSPGRKKMVYAEGHLYLLYHNYDMNTTVTIDSYLFTDPTAPPLPTRQIFKGSDKFLSSYFFAGTRGGTTFLGGLGEVNDISTPGQDYMSFTMDIVDGAPQSPTVSTSPFYNFLTISDGSSSEIKGVAVHDNFVTLGGQLPGQNPFIVGLASEGIYQFSTIGKNGTNVLGIMDVVIPKRFRGSVPRKTTMEKFYDRDSVRPSDRSNAEVLWIIFGVTVGLFICIMFNDYRKRFKKRAAEEQQEQERQKQHEQVEQQRQEQYVEMGVRGAFASTAATDTSR
ncbi:hypothetical protein BG015_010230 [Linnemannia schmuckeri]|uniref:Uncharacterized protein n=1 Tax=Linnemannia schmuckeri TaxID=64567 RepID=A0A9P5RX41_9FUNG|nr:hypothetical protein BG015_010230 [Linnemannia schmuckeri]